MSNSDVVTIMGSDMAENHPVAFRWVMKAKEKGARIIHIDPRFTRTSAVADIFVPIRSGSDIAFLGTSGVDAELGVWDTTMVEVPIKRLIIAGADQVVLIADVAKFSMTGMVRVCGPESLDHVVTDAPLPAAVRSVVDANAIEVTIA